MAKSKINRPAGSEVSAGSAIAGGRTSVERQPQIGVGTPNVGAHIEHDYLVRRQRFVAVNETDLDELLSFDLISQGLIAAGIFVLSGSLWIAIDRLLDSPEITIQVVAMLAVSICGLVLLMAGGAVFLMKRKKIKKIFSETKKIDPSETPISAIPSPQWHSGTGQRTPQ